MEPEADKIGEYVAAHLHEGIVNALIPADLHAPGINRKYPKAWIISGPPGWDRLLVVVDDLEIKWGHVPYEEVRSAVLNTTIGFTKVVDLGDPESFEKLDRLVKDTVYAIKVGKRVVQ